MYFFENADRLGVLPCEWNYRTTNCMYIYQKYQQHIYMRAFFFLSLRIILRHLRLILANVLRCICMHV